MDLLCLVHPNLGGERQGLGGLMDGGPRIVTIYIYIYMYGTPPMDPPILG